MPTLFEKIRNFLIYLFLFLLPWQTRLIWRAGELNGGYWEYGVFSIYASEVILWAALLLTGTIAFKKWFKSEISNSKSETDPKSKIKKFLILLVSSYLLLVTVFALRKDVHFYYLLRFAEGVVLYFLIRSVDRGKAMWAFILGMVPQAMLGIWQFLAQSSFASKWLGMALHDPSVLGTFVVETADGRWLRAYGGMPHPNILGGYLVLAILLLFQVSGFRFQVLKKFPISNFQFLTLVSLVVLFSSASFFTFSRSAWVALFIGLLSYWFINPSPPPPKRGGIRRGVLPLLRGGRVGLYPLSLIVLVFIILGIIFHEPALARLQNQNRLEVKSQVERVSGYEEAWQIIRRHSVAGVGLGNYTYAVWKEIDSSRPSYAYQPVHNIFVLLLAEVGIVGVLLLFIFLFLDVKPLMHKRFNLTILSTILVLGFFDHYLLTLYPGVILLFLINSLIKNPPN